MFLCDFVLFCANKSIVSAPEGQWHSRGQRFDPAYLHHRVLKTIGFQDFFFVKTVVFPVFYGFSNLVF